MRFVRTALMLGAIALVASCGGSNGKPESAASDSDQGGLSDQIRGDALVEVSSVEVLDVKAASTPPGLESSFDIASLRVSGKPVFANSKAKNLPETFEMTMSIPADSSVEDQLGGTPPPAGTYLLVERRPTIEEAGPSWSSDTVLASDDSGQLRIVGSDRLTEELQSFSAFVADRSGPASGLEVVTAWLADKSTHELGDPADGIDVDMIDAHQDFEAANVPKDPDANADRSSADPEIASRLVDRAIDVQIDAKIDGDTASVSFMSDRGTVAAIQATSDGGVIRATWLPGETWVIAITDMGGEKAPVEIGTIDAKTLSANRGLTVTVGRSASGYTTTVTPMQDIPAAEEEPPTVTAPEAIPGDGN